MTTNYDAKAQKAYAMVLAKGKLITVRSLAVAPLGDATKPWRGATSPRPGTELTVPALMLDPKESLLGFMIKDDEGKFKSSDIVYIAAPGLLGDITFADEVVDGSNTYTINEVQKLQPGNGAAILYYLRCSL